MSGVCKTQYLFLIGFILHHLGFSSASGFNACPIYVDGMKCCTAYYNISWAF